jgi:hypothetical protein
MTNTLEDCERNSLQARARTKYITFARREIVLAIFNVSFRDADASGVKSEVSCSLAANVMSL